MSLLLPNSETETGELRSLVPLVSLLWSHEGKPVDLSQHFHWEPLFERDFIPDENTLTCGRQMGKSFQLALLLLTWCAIHRNLKVLVVTPLQQTVQRFSSLYLDGLLSESPARSLLMTKGFRSTVFHKRFSTNSDLFCTFAYRDVLRTRGFKTDFLFYDERQSMNPDFADVIDRTMDASKIRKKFNSGTATTTDGLLARDFLHSSGGEWVIRCEACNYWNIPSLEYDLDKMIAPPHPDVGPTRAGVVCAKCSRPLDPRPHGIPNGGQGRWEHRRPHLRNDHRGMHLPQIVSPLHYANKKMWRQLWNRYTSKTYPRFRFYNEICGEPYDVGAKLITETDVRNAAVLELDRRFEQAKDWVNKKVYRGIAVGCDWGGGGRRGVSYTVIGAGGLLPTGKIDVFYGYQSSKPHDHQYEANLVLTIARQLSAEVIAHDFLNGGDVREAMIVGPRGVNWPSDRLMPIAYQPPGKGQMVRHHGANAMNGRHYWMVARSRAILTVLESIKQGWIRFFRWDYRSPDDPGLLVQLTNVTDDRSVSSLGRQLHVLTKSVDLPDDFLHAVTFLCTALWHRYMCWPPFTASLFETVDEDTYYDVTNEEEADQLAYADDNEVEIT